MVTMGDGTSRATLRALLLVTLLGGCDHRPLSVTGQPSAEGEATAADRVFFDDFESGELPKWDPLVGDWRIDRSESGQTRYAADGRDFALTVAGAPGWTDYRLSAVVILHDDRDGPVGVVARLQSSHFHYELLLGRQDGGRKGWMIRRRLDHTWTTLAHGAFDYRLGQPHVLRLLVEKQHLTGQVSTDGGRSFFTLGSADADTGREMVNGRIGLITYGGRATFDDVDVTNLALLAAAPSAYSPIVLVRDNTNRFTTGKPAGGWYVVGIHGSLRASDGKVLISGWSRAAPGTPDACTSSNSSQNATTWVFDPATYADQNPYLITSLDEQDQEVANGDAIYCAGQTQLADGRILIVGGSRHPGNFPHTTELGLNYSRIFDPFNNGAGAGIGTFTRISAPMKGGPANASPTGTKWYPTAIALPDGKILTFGGFSFNSGGTGDHMNQSLETFDPAVWDADHNADPWTVLTQHEEGDILTTPTRGYTNLFLLPRPVAAAAGGGFARTVALSAGAGKMFLWNHEPGPTGTQRLLGRSTTPNPSTTEKGEGASGVVLPDGRIMYDNGGHDGVGSARAYFYNPYDDSWTDTPPLTLGTSRIYGDSIWLPDGTVLLINGYTSEAGSVNDIAPPWVGGDPTDPSNPIGGARAAEIIDPFAMTVTTLPPWPELTTRGYHSIAVLLKDGRVLLAGGKDASHATGCEKNELRLFSPPYLSAGPRPVNLATQGTAMTVGGPPVTINYTGSLRAVRAVSLLHPGALTHGFDMGQRYVPLTYTVPTPGTLMVTPPANINIAPPGDYVMYLISDLGVPSLGVHIKLGAPPACTYAIDGSTTTFLEVEGRSRQSGPFVDVADGSASGGHYVQVADGSGDQLAMPDEGEVMWYDLNVFGGGSLFVSLYGNGPDASSNTAWVSIDGTADLLYTAPVGSWGWGLVGTGALSLTSGRHTLKIKVRGDGLKIDKVSISRTSGLPSGQGAAALTCNNPPPATWTDQDVGTTSIAGGSSQSAGVFTVNGSGADIWTAADGFHYLYQNATGDVTITARVAQTLTANPSPPNVWEKAGVMIRENVGAGARNAFTLVSFDATHQYRYQIRTATAGTTSGTAGGAGTTPVWLRVSKVGNVLSGFTSSDGVTWTAIGAPTTFTGFPSAFTVGLAITSHDNTRLGTAVFDNVSISAPAPPPAPTNLVATGGDNKVTLSWAASPGAASYTVKRSTTMGGPYTPLTPSPTSPGFTDGSALNGTRYFYVVTASNTAGEGPPSGEASATPAPPPPPPPPTNLVATGGNHQVALSWTASSGATSYTVMRGTTMGGPYSALTPSPTSPGFTDGSALNGTTYFYVVTAANSGGASGPSGEASATPALPRPSGVTAAPGNAQVTLSWSAVANATSYAVKRSTTMGGPYAVVPGGASVASPPFTDVGLTNGVPVFYVVSASDATSTSPDSAEVSATPAAAMGPSAPTNLNATIASGNTVTLTWTDTSSNETGFRVERKVGTGSFATLATKAANVQTHVDGSLTPNTYTYQVIATGTPDSAPSNQVVVVLRNPDADAHVRDGTANVDANYGANTTIEVKNTTAAGNNRQAFVRFTLADLGATVTSAKIRLFGNSVTTAKTLALSGVSSITWVEGTGTIAAPVTATGIDWNSKPAIGTQITSLSVGTTAAYSEFDVTSYVQAQRTAGATKVTIAVTMVTSSNDSPTVFNTRENAANKPLLVVSSR